MSISVGDLFLGLNINPKNINKQISNAASQSQNIAQKSFGKVGRTIATALSTAAIVSFGKSCLNLGSDLAEVQNVVDVTFPHMSDQVNNFAKNAINQFGLSETVAKRMTGTYGAMSKAFGFSESAAYNMATALTGLAGDVASFYNLDPTEAYTKLKSVFSGETETLKDLGIVMTQNALDQYALANGYGKTTSAMSEQEKVSLRLAFVTEQLSAAGGDFARTSDSWANKTRVLSLNFQSLMATLGQGLINVLSPLVSMLNTVIVKLQTAAQWFVTFTSLLSNNKKTSSTLGSVSSVLNDSSTGAKALADNISGFGDAAKKVAKQVGFLAGFDELNVIKSTNDSSDSEIGSSLGMGGLDMESGMGSVPDIDTSKMEESVNKLQNLWSKFTTFFKNNGNIIISIISGIVSGFLAFETLKNIKGIIKYITPLKEAFQFTGLCASDFFSTLSSGKGIIAALSSVFGPASAIALVVATSIAAVTATLVYLYNTSDSFRNLVNEAVGNIGSILTNLWSSILKPLFSLVVDFFNTVLVPLASFISKVFVRAVQTIASVVLAFWNNVLAPIANFLVDVLGIALQCVIDVMKSWKPAIEMLFDTLNWLWDEILKPVVDWITNTMITTFENWGEVINELIPSIKQMFQGLIDFFIGVFTGDLNKAWSGIQSIFQGFDNFLTGVFTTDWSKSFGNFGNILNGFFQTASNIWNGIKKVFSGIIDFVSGVFTGDWKRAWQGVKNIFEGIFNSLAGVVKAPINAVIGIINGAVDKINGFGFDVPNWVPFIGGKSFKVSVPKLNYLAEGGFVKANTPQLAVVGDNKRYGEIISPENKMHDVMLNAMKEFYPNGVTREDIQVIVSIMYEIIELIKNLRLVIDGDSLNEDSKKRDLERALRTGNLVFD